MSGGQAREELLSDTLEPQLEGVLEFSENVTSMHETTTTLEGRLLRSPLLAIRTTFSKFNVQGTLSRGQRLLLIDGRGTLLINLISSRTKFNFVVRTPLSCGY